MSFGVQIIEQRAVYVVGRVSAHRPKLTHDRIGINLRPQTTLTRCRLR